MGTRKIVIATSNQGKLREFEELLQPLGIGVLSLRNFPEIGEIEENGATFGANALIKAKTVAQATGLLSLADDSGLEVDYLGGLPGVNSARFAGEPKDDHQNNKKLLELMQDVPLVQRTARFRCVIAIVSLNQKEYLAEGSCEGLILDNEKGCQGFGYDPLFYVPQYDKTFAQLEMEIKNKISHRGIATQKAINILREIMN